VAAAVNLAIDQPRRGLAMCEAFRAGRTTTPTSEMARAGFPDIVV
jgi:hypothetical protein